ncbi:hypothetical protein ACQR1W_27920 [Bradyrhizobium sp. HKCCYLS1011]|uniref:hypothetical protein n=1 Tax=Bradyrhizobium sp. HKCCYLS1011 TaxID=3420733 RepID=UPI003EBD1543
MPKENDLEGPPDMGGKHGGQAGVPKPTPRPDPHEATKSGDVPARQSTTKPDRS